MLEIVAEGARHSLGALKQLAATVAEVKPGEPAAVLAARIEVRLHELVSLLSNAVDYDRLLAGRALVEPAGFDLRAMLDEFAARLRTPLGAGWRLETSATADVPMSLVGDPGRWRDALEILLLEVASVAASGVVRLEVSRREESASGVVLCLRLRACPGAPIDARVVDAVLRRHSGLAAGRPLTASAMRADLARRIVAANGGTLRAPVLEGNELVLELDAPFGIRQVANAEPGPAPRADLRGLRLLLAGTDRRQGRQDAALLRLWGCEVTLAADGLGALHELRTAHESGRDFDAVLVADDLGGMEGAVFGRLVRVQPEFARVRLVLRFDLGVRGDSAAAREIGFDAYLPSALPGRELREALAELLRRDCASLRGGSILTRHDLAELRNERRRVLVVGFPGVDGLVVRSLLERRGFASQATASGVEAVEAWERARHDLVVVQAGDDEDSLATAIALQVLLDEEGGVPLLLVLGPGTPSARAKAEQAGIRHVMAREPELQGLCERIEGLLVGGGRPVAEPTVPRRAGLQIVSGLDRAEDYPVLSRERLRDSSLDMPALEIELIDTFCDEVEPRVRRLEQLCAEGAADTLTQPVVDLKALAMTVGAYALGRVCAAVEGLVHEDRHGEIEPMMRRLREESVHAREALVRHREQVMRSASGAA